MINDLHLIDCMEYMKGCSDNQFDLAIVDPPYGIGWDGKEIPERMQIRGNGTKPEILRDKHIQKKWDKSKPDERYFNELFRISQNQIIWGGNYFPLPPARCVICWDKKQAFKIFSAWEMAWTSFLSVMAIFRYDNKGFMNKEGSNIHPTQKPVALYKWLLTNYAKPEDKLFDSHSGSGSFRIAAHDLGFDLISCELDPDYHRDNESRFQNHIKQGELFDSDEIQKQVFKNHDLF